MTIEHYLNATLITLFFLSASFLGATIAIRLDRWYESKRKTRIVRKTFYEAGLPIEEVSK